MANEQDKPRGAGTDLLIAIAGAVAGAIAYAWLTPPTVVVVRQGLGEGEAEKDETPADG